MMMKVSARRQGMTIDIHLEGAEAELFFRMVGQITGPFADGYSINGSGLEGLRDLTDALYDGISDTAEDGN